MQHRFHADKMLREKCRGKFHREKLVRLIRRALCREGFILAMIKPDRARRKISALVFTFHKTIAREI